MTSLVVARWLGAVFAVFILLAGIFILGVSLFDYLAITAEEDLIFAEGVADEVQKSHQYYRRNTTYTVTFTIAGYKTGYNSNHPKYSTVASAVTSGKPVRVWVSPKTTLINDGQFQLYKLSSFAGDLTYEETVAAGKLHCKILLITGTFLFCFGVVLVIYTWYDRRRRAAANARVDESSAR